MESKSFTFRQSGNVTAEEAADPERYWTFRKEKARREFLTMILDIPLQYDEWEEDGRRYGRWTTKEG